MYIYDKKTTTDQFLDYIIPIPFEDVEKCLIYAYAKISYSWFLLPGQVDFSVTTAIALNDIGTETQYNVIFTKTADGSYYTGGFTFNAFRIIVVPIPAANITEVKGAAPVDYSNYAEVAKYYGLPE
jgi:hypothetical protein